MNNISVGYNSNMSWILTCPSGGRNFAANILLQVLLIAHYKYAVTAFYLGNIMSLIHGTKVVKLL